jgi:hypothetical protein
MGQWQAIYHESRSRAKLASSIRMNLKKGKVKNMTLFVTAKGAEMMKTRRAVPVGIVLALALLCTSLGFAQKKPAQNVSPKRHPNIAAAQRLSAQAFQRIVDAQNANEWDLAGHAQKAKELLDEANKELKKAAEVANINHQ